MNAGLIILGDKSKKQFCASAEMLSSILCNQGFILSDAHFFNYFGEKWQAKERGDLYEKIKENVKYCKQEGLEDIVIIYVGHGVIDEKYNLYISNDDTPTQPPDLTKNFSISKLLENDIGNIDINKWLILDCCKSAAIHSAIHTGEGQTIAICCSGKEKSAKIKYSDSDQFTRFVQGLTEILTVGKINPLSINQMIDELKNTSAYKGKKRPYIVDPTGRLAQEQLFPDSPERLK